jgi:hypothetical protein
MGSCRMGSDLQYARESQKRGPCPPDFLFGSTTPSAPSPRQLRTTPTAPSPRQLRTTPSAEAASTPRSGVIKPPLFRRQEESPKLLPSSMAPPFGRPFFCVCNTHYNIRKYTGLKLLCFGDLRFVQLWAAMDLRDNPRFAFGSRLPLLPEPRTVTKIK